MPKLIRTDNYSGNLSNNLVSNVGCKGTSNNCLAAAGIYQAGGTSSVSTGYSTNVTDDAGVLGSPLRTYKSLDSVQSLSRGGNNFPKLSTDINQLTAKVLSGGARKTKKKYHKGSKSKTLPGKKDFTTKKKSKMYNEKRLKRLFGRRTARAPFFPFVGGVGAKGFSHPKKGQKSRTRKGRLDFTTKKGNKYFDRKGHRSRHAKKSLIKRKPYMKGGGNMSPLQFSKVPSSNTLPVLSNANSKYYSVNFKVDNANKGGKLANPVPFVSKSLCPSRL